MENDAWNDETSSANEESTETESLVKEMVSEISHELVLVHSGRYDEKRAIKAAALALKIQLDLADFLSDVEASAKGLKIEVKGVESEIYYENKSSSSEKKISEAALQQSISKDKRYCDAELKSIKAEKTAKKWALIFGTMKEAHIFFRNLGKE
jgi:hypothetical protein